MSPLSLDTLQWQPAHDRTSVEHFLDAYARERERLLTEIEAAHARTAAARSRATHNVVDVDLVGLLQGARAALDAVERRHDDEVRAIREAAATEAARILAEGPQ